MLHFVYGLIDPRTDTVAYVGITSAPNSRLQQHIQRTDEHGKNRKEDWVRQLREERLEPRMTVLEFTDDRQKALEREKHWIQHFISLGVSLTNTQKTSQKRSKVDSICLPDGYYTRGQALDRLDIDPARFPNYTKKIKCLRPEGCRYYIYLKSDVKKLAIKLHGMFPPGCYPRQPLSGTTQGFSSSESITAERLRRIVADVVGQISNKSFRPDISLVETFDVGTFELVYIAMGITDEFGFKVVPGTVAHFPTVGGLVSHIELLLRGHLREDHLSSLL